MNKRTRSLFAALFCLLIGVTAFAQSNTTTGQITGRVSDNTGGGLPGVTVTATNTDTGLTRNTVTESDGTYNLSLLQPGKYRLEAELAGLGKAGVPSVNVLLGNSTKADIKLTPQVTEQITVTAAAPVVDTTRSGTAASVTEQQIENLPILGRDFRSLAQLTPGVADAFGSRLTANGARGIATDYNIDGATSNNDFFGEQTGGTRAPFTFSQAAIKEFQVIRSQYSAEYGRGVGATVNAITKSGSNDLDGEAFYYLRKKSWASTRNQIINGLPVTDSFRAKDSSQPGFALGGPIVHDKLFYFINGDFQRQKLPIFATDPTTATFANSQFVALTPAQQQTFLAKIQSLTGVALADQINYDQTFNQNTYLAKLDANVGMKNHFSVRDNFTNFENGNNQSFNLFSNQGIEHDKFNQAVGQGESVFTNNLFNQVIVQYAKDERPIDPNVGGPEISFTYATNPTRSAVIGANSFLPNNTVEKKTQFKDTLTYVLGDHNVKAGTELLFNNIDNLFPRNLNGRYVYNSITAFLNDTPNTFQQGYGAGGGLTSWKQNTYAFFASDNFHVGTKWTFDAGLRYDWQTMPKPATNAFPAHPEFITDIKEDKNNIAPRLGFAYDVMGNGRSVLRGGTGRFFGYMPDILLSNPLTQISGNFNQITLTCATATTVKCPTYPGILTPEQFAILARVSTDIVTISPDYQAQEAWRSSLQFEQQLGTTYSVGVGGIYSRMTHVQGSVNVNAVATGLNFGDVPVYSFNAPNRRYTDLGVVRQLTSNERGTYRSFTLETHKLAINNAPVSWDVSYTFSRSIDQDTNERSTSTSFLYDPLNPKLSEGLSDNDVTHRFVGDVTYRLPFGFQVSGIASYRTGVPYTAGISFIGSGTNATSLNGLSQTSGNIPIYLDSNGNVIDLTQASGLTRSQFQDFLGARGAHILGRNTERQPDVFNIDLRLSKVFGLPGGIRLEVLGEAFNLVNQKNRFVGTANQQYFGATLTAATDVLTFTRNVNFGKTNGYLSTSDPRQYQVAAKFVF